MNFNISNNDTRVYRRIARIYELGSRRQRYKMPANYIYLILIISLWLSWTPTADGELIKRPHSITVAAGETVKVICHSSVFQNVIYWYRTKAKEPEIRLLYDGSVRDSDQAKIKVSEEVANSTLKSTLIIWNVSFDDAGVISCRDGKGNGDVSSVYLNVYEKKPHCLAWCMDEKLLLFCSFCFKSEKTLSIRWYLNGSISIDEMYEREFRVVEYSCTQHLSHAITDQFCPEIGNLSIVVYENTANTSSRLYNIDVHLYDTATVTDTISMIVHGNPTNPSSRSYIINMDATAAAEKLIERLYSITVEAGETVKFICQSSVFHNSTYWYFVKARENSIHILYDGYVKTSDRAKIEVSEKVVNNTLKSTLVIRNITYDDAGVISCRDDKGNGAVASALLNVYAKSPHCLVLRLAEKLLLVCLFYYKSEIPLSARWLTNGFHSIGEMYGIEFHGDRHWIQHISHAITDQFYPEIGNLSMVVYENTTNTSSRLHYIQYDSAAGTGTHTVPPMIVHGPTQHPTNTTVDATAPGFSWKSIIIVAILLPGVAFVALMVIIWRIVPKFFIGKKDMSPAPDDGYISLQQETSRNTTATCQRSTGATNAANCCSVPAGSYREVSDGGPSRSYFFTKLEPNGADEVNYMSLEENMNTGRNETPSLHGPRSKDSVNSFSQPNFEVTYTQPYMAQSQ